ncbi:MAG: hypothetical protein KJ967_06095, partial [Elusimicrobia bacterium]|nr:hypothetical protein [Elusimicrobiota bacterium]
MIFRIMFFAIIIAGVFGFSGNVFAVYNTSGLLRSTNLLSGTSGAASIDSFGYTVSAIPANTTLQINFTGDGGNWYAADGTLDGWTSLTVGSNSIVLSGLPWQGAYFAYKIYMTSDGSDTPVLDSITFNYTAYDASRGVEISYPASGSLISTNLFDGVGSVASVDSFDYIVSAMPAGTGVVIQFSQDQTNWYGSDGILDNSDTLSAGSNNIGLSGLEWSGANFYYKLTFTSDESNTSVLTSIAVNYTDDATAPTTTPTATAGGASYTFDTWTNKTSLSVLLTCADNAGGVGCATTYYCQDTANTCTPTTTYSSAVAVSTEGTSYIRYYSTDTVPNSETTASQIIKIDTTAPVTAFSSTRSTNNITATLTCADSGSSCSVTYYCTDLTNECTPTTAYTSAVSLSISQNTYFRYYSIDFVSNS